MCMCSNSISNMPQPGIDQLIEWSACILWRSKVVHSFAVNNMIEAAQRSVWQIPHIVGRLIVEIKSAAEMMDAETPLIRYI